MTACLWPWLFFWPWRCPLQPRRRCPDRLPLLRLPLLRLPPRHRPLLRLPLLRLPRRRRLPHRRLRRHRLRLLQPRRPGSRHRQPRLPGSRHRQPRLLGPHHLQHHRNPARVVPHPARLPARGRLHHFLSPTRPRPPGRSPKLPPDRPCRRRRPRPHRYRSTSAPSSEPARPPHRVRSSGWVPQSGSASRSSAPSV